MDNEGAGGSKREWAAFLMTPVCSGGKEGHLQGRSGGWGGVCRAVKREKNTIQSVRCSVKTLDGSLLKSRDRE